ncbi:hypothetical protein RRG37_01170 [Mycoplasmopsis felis]|uniref:ABC transporter thiamine pyrophosphate-binding lipoprotein p37/Cypl n=1 Tax=Mycoplasmopsis felis TaxID=33923 RepID=UPI002AFE15B3|nr:hypothetical protein [Mycoplasmopsis felis]WQQ06017.1 hypothetical protein RRG40_02865 [Mycoplasmopsis felis]
MLLKKILNSLFLSLPLISVVSLTSCKKETETKLLKINMLAPYILGEFNNETDFKLELEKRLNNEIQQLGSDFKVQINFKGDDDSYETNSIDILKGNVDFAFISSGYLINNKDRIKKNNLKVGIQTLSKQFKGDIEYDFKNKDNQINQYQDGINDDLRKIAQKENELFHLYPRSTWEEKNKWNGSIYTEFYTNKNVPYQRGVMVILGSEEERNLIKKAWEDKNLEEFLKYGLVVGKPSSGSKYILPEALFKKHFGNKFISFADLITKGLIKQGEFKQMNTPNYIDSRIFFDNEGSYSYTKYKPNSDRYELSSERSNQKIEYFITTEVLPYNVGLFSNRIPDRIIRIFGLAMQNLRKNNQDIWGSQHGFNDYRYIQNQETEFWDVINKTLGK